MDTDAPGRSGPELKEYTALLRRRWRLIGAGMLGGLVLATAGVLVLPSTYTSVTAVQVRPTGMAEFTGEESGRLTGDVNLDTEAQVVVSEQVSDTAGDTIAETTGTSLSSTELRERVDVTVPPNSNVLEIHYSGGTPEDARAGADAYADAYLDLREAEVNTLIDDRLEALRAEQDALYETLGEVASDETRAAQAQVEALREEITELGNGLGPLSALQETVDPGDVITHGDLPETATSPMPALWLAGGAALGLVAGLLTAVARERLDPRLHDSQDTARVGGLPVLLDLSGRGGRTGRFPGLLADTDRDGQRVNEFAHLVRARMSAGAAPLSAASDRVAGISADGSATAPHPAEAHRPPSSVLSDTDLLSGTGAEGPARGRILLTTATTPGRAGAATAVNLAAALARTGSEALLVCADPRTETVGELLGLAEGPGLAEALVEGEDPARLEVRPYNVPRLRVLRYGRPGLTSPVQGTSMQELLGLLRSGAEYVVVAAPATTERADAHALAATADVLLPVVELGRARRADLTGLLTTAARLGVLTPGTVVLPRQPAPGPEPGPAPPGRTRTTGHGAVDGAGGSERNSTDAGTGAASSMLPASGTGTTSGTVRTHRRSARADAASGAGD